MNSVCLRCFFAFGGGTVLEEIGDGRECEQESHAEQNKGNCIHATEGDVAPTPRPVEKSPGNEPNQNGCGGDSGERASGLIDGEQACYRRQLVPPGQR